MTAPSRADLDRWNRQVRRDWTDQETIAAWRKWFPQSAVLTQAATDVLVAGADLHPGGEVLDLACGSGEPALSLAELVGPRGHVTATDLSFGQLAIARDNARRRALANLRFLQIDAQSLPFADQSFDRVTCRFGVMYFPDLPRALSEVRRVLRPSGRVAFLVWGPEEENALTQATSRVVMRHAAVPPPAPGAPGQFRFAASGSLSRALQDAGFVDLAEASQIISLPWPGSPETLWESTVDLSTPLRRLIGGLSAEQRETVFREVLAAIRASDDGQRVTFRAPVILATARR